MQKPEKKIHKLKVTTAEDLANQLAGFLQKNPGAAIVELYPLAQGSDEVTFVFTILP